MLFNEIVIDVRKVSKHYEIYTTPRDRLKQLVLPVFYQIVNRAVSAFGLTRRSELKRYYRKFEALNNVTFQVSRGECIGVIGKNGSGKSTLLQVITGTLTPTQGSVSVIGRITALLELGSGFNPEFTGRENVYLNASILGLRSAEMKARLEEIEAFADIGDFIDQPVKTYSSGMLMRLAFATQTALDPDILIVDEALAVGDMSFQIKCFARMNQLREKGTTILFVSHSLGTILSFCDKALYLRKGEQAAFGQVAGVARQYEQDCIEDKMIPKHLAATKNNDASVIFSSVSIDEETNRLASVVRDYRPNFLVCAAGGTREGSKTVTIESFVLVSSDGAPLEMISPTEQVVGCFLLKMNTNFEGAIHLSIQVFDKSGSPVMVIRDSYFEQLVTSELGNNWLGLMKFTLPLMAGIYYCRVGVLLYPAFQKYSNGQHNFEQAEISDLIEQGAHFEVLTFDRHSIPLSVLNESKLTLVSV